jgi:uncharacterized protein (DUF1501 family)
MSRENPKNNLPINSLEVIKAAQQLEQQFAKPATEGVSQMSNSSLKSEQIELAMNLASTQKIVDQNHSDVLNSEENLEKLEKSASIENHFNNLNINTASSEDQKIAKSLSDRLRELKDKK